MLGVSVSSLFWHLYNKLIVDEDLSLLRKTFSACNGAQSTS